MKAGRRFHNTSSLRSFQNSVCAGLFACHTKCFFKKITENENNAAELKLRTCFTVGSLFVTLREIERNCVDLTAEVIFISQHHWQRWWRPTRAKGLTLLSAPMASSSCCGDRPHSRFLTAQTESVTAAALVTDCSGKREEKGIRVSTNHVLKCCGSTDLRV